MLFKFLKSTLHLDVVTYRKEVLELHPIDYTHKFIPKWFKKTPSNISKTAVPQGSLRTCTGIRDIFNTGITIPNWSDFVIYKDQDKKNIVVKYSDNQTQVDFHDAEQWKLYLNDDKYFHFKIVAPWSLRCKQDVKFLFTGFHWGLNPFMIHIPSGIMRFNLQDSCHINAFIQPGDFKEVMFLAGKPIAQLLPLTEKKLKLHYHLEKYEDFDHISKKFSLYFINRFNRIKKDNKRK